MKTEHFMVSTLDFFRVFFVKNFFPKFELLNSGCGLSASATFVVKLLLNLWTFITFVVVITFLANYYICGFYRGVYRSSFGGCGNVA